MKKFFLTIVTIVIAAVALSVSFISCNKDSSSGDSLSGTTWTASPAGWKEVYTLKFNTGGSVSLTYEDGTDKETLYGKYSYDGNVYMEFTGGSESTSLSLYGIVSGNEMVLSDEHGDSLTFTKNK